MCRYDLIENTTIIMINRTNFKLTSHLFIDCRPSRITTPTITISLDADAEVQVAKRKEGKYSGTMVFLKFVSTLVVLMLFDIQEILVTKLLYLTCIILKLFFNTTMFSVYCLFLVLCTFFVV